MKTLASLTVALLLSLIPGPVQAKEYRPLVPCQQDVVTRACFFDAFHEPRDTLVVPPEQAYNFKIGRAGRFHFLTHDEVHLLYQEWKAWKRARRG